MRSYYSHLQAVKNIGEEVPVNYKPTFRSSAIFPIIHSLDYSSKVIFMGYWLLKRNIREIGLLYTLRNAQGIILSRKYTLINTTKAFSISLNEFDHVVGMEFTGSLELEIFSSQDLIYPYPAFVLVYYNDHFSTAVHTTGRIYNDTDDLVNNGEYAVRESGFDIYDDPHLSPFVGITNGTLENTAVKFDYEINNAVGDVFKGSFQVPPIKPYETIFLELRKYIDLSAALKQGVGSIKLGHNFSGFFPRFVVGNFDNRSKSISITHSYYDSSELKDDKSFWNRKDSALNDSYVSIPLYLTDGYYTRLAIYPIFSPSDFKLSFFFYTKDGELLKAADTIYQINSADNKYKQIDLGDIVKKENINIQKAASVYIVCNWDDKNKIPTRVKFALNVGKTQGDTKLPSNICFSAQLGNPHMLTKKGTFKWAPFINIGRSEVVFTNFGSSKNYTTPAVLKLAFHREDDDTLISRELTVSANGCERIDLSADQELTAFFNHKSGWVTAQSNNPFLNGYYFDFFDNGAVCADHIF